MAKVLKQVKVLVIGNGGREHALAWKLLQSERVNQVVCVPGNGGTANLKGCQNLPLSVKRLPCYRQIRPRI